jgi:hypothetical protein
VAVGEPNDGSYLWTVPEVLCSTSRLRVIARDAAGFAAHDDSDEDFSTGPPTGIAPLPAAWRLSLAQNVPNPFSPLTRIAYTLPCETRATLEVYDISGRLVRRLVDRELPPGEHAAEWDGRTADGQETASGIYFYRLWADDREITRKMVLLR